MKKKTARRSTKRKAAPRHGGMLKVLACAALLGAGFGVWKAKDHFAPAELSCAPAMASDQVNITCAAPTQKPVPGSQVFAYTLANKTNSTLKCELTAHMPFHTFVMNENVSLAPLELRAMEQVLPTPDVSSEISLSAECVATSTRSVASPN